MAKKFVLFDLDGVLCSTQKIHYKAFNQALNQYGLNISFEYHDNFLEGLSTAGKLSILSETYDLSLFSTSEFSQAKQKFTIELLEQEIKNDAILRQYLTDLVRNDLDLCVCSNARRLTLDLTLNLLGVRDIFSFSISYEDVKAAKPAPDVYLAAVSMFKAKKEDCLVIEDSDHGVKAALSAGLDYIQVKKGYQDLLLLDLKEPF